MLGVVVLFLVWVLFFFFFSSRRRHTRSKRDWSSDVCSSDLDLLSALDDPAVAVRFTLVGAVGRAAANGKALRPEQRDRLLARLLSLLAKDADQIGRASCRERV